MRLVILGKKRAFNLELENRSLIFKKVNNSPNAKFLLIRDLSIIKHVIKRKKKKKKHTRNYQFKVYVITFSYSFIKELKNESKKQHLA